MKIFKYTLFLNLIFLILACSDAKHQTETKDKTTSAALVKYTCPMHPQIIEDKPGNCPICNMELVKVKAQEKTSGITLSENQMRLGNIKTMNIGTGNFSDAKLLNARIVENPMQTEVIASKFSGRVDQLFFKEVGLNINKGQALYRIYSEELLTLQKDYLLNWKQQNAFPQEKIYQTLLKASKSKLSLYGYSENQINGLQKNGQTNPYITVYAPISGVIKEINISEGQYVSEGNSIFKIENLNNLWVEADLYPTETSNVKIGKSISVTVSGFENLPIQSKVEFLSPQLNAASQIITLRTSIQNIKNQFQPGMQAEIHFPYDNQNKVITLPTNAVLRDQNGNHIWIETKKNYFEYRMVTLGNENADQVLIKSGLTNGDKVVVNGAYLLSSEFILKKGGSFMAGMNR